VNCESFEADDGTRTRDPHLGKVSKVMLLSSTFVYFRSSDPRVRVAVSDREYPVLAVSCGGDAAHPSLR
jgi:hypothetical protein